MKRRDRIIELIYYFAYWLLPSSTAIYILFQAMGFGTMPSYIAGSLIAGYVFYYVNMWIFKSDGIKTLWGFILYFLQWLLPSTTIIYIYMHDMNGMDMLLSYVVGSLAAAVIYYPLNIKLFRNGKL